jgi:GrpB-like predicted nucleotidyltransferase (UPF0157 family)
MTLSRPLRDYSISPYDPTWPDLYASYIRLLEHLFGNQIQRSFHVGSTSVPGLQAKPTIDIILEVRDLGLIDQRNEAMSALGYTSFGAYLDPKSRFFAIERHNHRIVNVHIFESGSQKMLEMLAMRDFLRAHPAESARYARLKDLLVNQFPHDYISYRNAKDSYLKNLAMRSIAWMSSQR